jgi:hypothetical protein
LSTTKNLPKAVERGKRGLAGQLRDDSDDYQDISRARIENDYLTDRNERGQSVIDRYSGKDRGRASATLAGN